MAKNSSQGPDASRAPTETRSGTYGRAKVGGSVPNRVAKYGGAAQRGLKTASCE